MTNMIPKYPLFSMRLLTVSDLDEFIPNPYNRPLVSSTLRDLDKILKKGTYIADEPILVNYESGIILNGHHRIEALKKYYAQSGVMPQVYVFFTNTPPESIVDLNQIGKKWSTEDYIRFHASEKPNKPKNLHYVYLIQARTEILAAQKKELISKKLTKSQIYIYLCGYLINGMGRSGFDKTRNDYIKEELVQIKLDKKYIIDVLPYYKFIESNLDFNVMLNTDNFKYDIFTFCLVCLCHGLDLTTITAKITSSKKIIKEIRDTLALKQHCFDVLFQAIPKQQLGFWTNFTTMRNAYQRKIAEGMLKPLTL